MVLAETFGESHAERIEQFLDDLRQRGLIVFGWLLTGRAEDLRVIAAVAGMVLADAAGVGKTPDCLVSRAATRPTVFAM